ncbi:hypothetical protein STEG23_030612 [Scotinomys teguina]
MRVISQRYPDIRIEGENYLPQPIYRHIASFLSVFKLVLIGLIIVGKDPFAFFGMQAPSIWQWGQENKVYACMMVFFLSNMIENQCMSTGAFEITLNDFSCLFSLPASSTYPFSFLAIGRDILNEDFLVSFECPKLLKFFFKLNASVFSVLWVVTLRVPLLHIPFRDGEALIPTLSLFE